MLWVQALATKTGVRLLEMGTKRVGGNLDPHVSRGCPRVCAREGIAPQDPRSEGRVSGHGAAL